MLSVDYIGPTLCFRGPFGARHFHRQCLTLYNGRPAHPPTSRLSKLTFRWLNGPTDQGLAIIKWPYWFKSYFNCLYLLEKWLGSAQWRAVCPHPLLVRQTNQLTELTQMHEDYGDKFTHFPMYLSLLMLALKLLGPFQSDSSILKWETLVLTSGTFPFLLLSYQGLGAESSRVMD